MTTIDDQRFFGRDHAARCTREPLAVTETGNSHSNVSRAIRVSMARAFPVRIASMREQLANGSMTKLARP